MNSLRKIFIAISLLTASCLLLSQYKEVFLPEHITVVNSVPEIKQIEVNQNQKTILYWTPMFQELNFNLGLGGKIFENCTYKNCYATHQKDLLPIEKYDAIAFHGVEYQESTFGKPKNRTPNQVYIFSIQESPVYTPSFIKNFNNFYNWTMTYRLDSDIVRPYGFIKKKKSLYHPPSVKEIQKRPKKIAWFVSNCGTSSNRERLYTEINKHVKVDVYGLCGDLHCSRKTSSECYDMIEKEYKFYLSFENSVCEDYVTEKLYHILRKNVVPIVYGGADYGAIAPPKSVINVMDFKSVKDLVEYIRFLDTHPEEYLKFFEWKKDYVVDMGNNLALCKLCQKLNEPIEPKIYSDLVQWWKGQKLDKCSTEFINNFIKM